MTILLRQLGPETVDHWVTAANVAGGLESYADQPPLWMLGPFQLTKRDKGLSLFEVDNEDEALVIAGAFAFQREKLGGGISAFLSAERKEVEKLGIGLVKSQGNLYHSFADDRHVELMLQDFSQIVSTLGAFLFGEFLVFEGKEVANAAKTSARCNQFSYSHLGARSFATNWSGKHLLTFVADRLVAVQGIPKPSGVAV